MRTVALFLHLGALVVGLGSVLTIDYSGMLWLLGRRSLRQSLEFAGPLHVPVWTGLAGLVLSGIALDPDPRAPLTRVKLVLVLLIALHGVHAQALHRTLGDQVSAWPPRRLLVRGVISAVLSQLGWWGGRHDRISQQPVMTGGGVRLVGEQVRPERGGRFRTAPPPGPGRRRPSLR
ncbi:hypothetical protein [Streptomyces sp. NPDC047869]|uniref:hypothetical protein n=1 Tax=Streptomyces sp. NPDC047869 TaxID=3154709 RepID=UPI0034549B57